MCGVIGIWDRGRQSTSDQRQATAQAMTEALHYRGPDAGDVWSDNNAGIALGHRRLAIVDLSPMGAQPMTSSCGRFVISYNGEVYNTQELKVELEAAGRTFRGHCDTEVIVEGAAVWGVAAIVKRLIGMFAIILWDRHERILYLVRDRLGIKPLYWTEYGGRLLVGSELKALRADESWQPELDRDALAAYLQYGYVPTPHSIYRHANKLPPGTIFTLGTSGAPRIESYWSLTDIARDGQSSRATFSEDEAAERLDTLLRDAVRCRMVADVPLGAFLSGGVDSSTVLALMQAQSTSPVKSFTIGFNVPEFDEAQHAAAVARHLGTEHTELYVSPSDAREVIPLLPDMYDEPFADSSQIPTYLVSQMTRRHVTVALSGDGGDELFGGYNRYLRDKRRWDRIDAAPLSLRKFGAAGIRTLSPAVWNRLGKVIPQNRRPVQFGEKLHHLACVMDGRSEASAFYKQVVSLWVEPEHLVHDANKLKGPLDDPRVKGLVPDFVERMQYLDTLTYLPDDILTKVDRASMAVSLEARVPLLDHRVVAFSWALPPAMKMQGGVGKRILRRVLHRYIPRELFERPKMGFAVPLHHWLRHDLRDWAEALLDERKITADGILNPAPIRKRWRELLAGNNDWQSSIWAVLAFQAWKERWLP